MTDTEQRCAFCEDTFVPHANQRQKYCSTDCRYRAAYQRLHDQRQAERAAREAAAATN